MAKAVNKEVAILGVGMHPWGKWGKNFVEYGIKACNDALADAGLEWQDIQFCSGAETVRNGYPGYVAGATFAQALGWSGARRLVGRPGGDLVRRLRLGSHRNQRRPGPDSGGHVRRGAGSGSRHHAQGLPGAHRRRALGRPRLASLPIARSHQPHLLCAVRPAAHGDLRLHRGGLREGPGQERPPRARESERALPQGLHGGGDPGFGDGGRSAETARCSRSAPPATVQRPWCSRAWSSLASEPRIRSRSPPSRR